MGISLTPYGYADWITSAKKHIYKIKKLIRDYYDLEVGVLIDKYSELLKVSNSPKVYISRRALKHFVERRKGDYGHLYDSTVILNRLDFAIDNIDKILNNHDMLEVGRMGSLIYTKHYPQDTYPSIRVVVDRIKDRYEIKSIHFRAYKKIQPFD